MNNFTQKFGQTMKNYNNHIFDKWILRLLLILFFIPILLSSCVQHRDLVYLREKGPKKDIIKTYEDPQIPDYRLKPKDELYIQINSLDDPSTNIFQLYGSQQGVNSVNITPYSASIESYQVNKDGNVLLPVIGSFQVKDRSVSQVATMLQDSLSHILSKPMVTVKLVNRYVSVLGEVRNPGHFTYAQEKLSIYSALGLAGDITDYGDRNDVILARNENGKNLRINVDLTSPDIMASKYYYIRPNDMVYVKPLRKKFWGMNGFPWTILLTTISTSVLVYTVFR